MIMFPVVLLVASAAADPPSVADPGSAVQETVRDINRTLRWHDRIARAPKAHHELLKVHSYSNRVILDVRVTSRTGFPFETGERTAAFASCPTLLDARGWEWEPTYFDGHIYWGPERRMLAVRPGGPVTYQVAVGTGSGPLHRFDWLSMPTAQRPATLDYHYDRWGPSVRRLDVVGRESVYALGRGTVPVEWSDEPAPEWTRKAWVKIDPPIALLAAVGGLPAAEHWPRERTPGR
jgi:hypothetical protein